MVQDSGTGERIYDRLKAALLTGSLTPHLRLDVAELSAHYEVSTTPVREAAMRLLGEGLLESHPRGGVRPALTTEFRLRTLLQLNERLLLAALDWAAQPLPTSSSPDEATSDEARTRRFFGELARATGNAEFVALIDRLSDRLAPFRHREQQLIADGAAEIATLRGLLSQPGALRRAVRSYHRRRTALVPQLVWLANLDPGADRADTQD